MGIQHRISGVQGHYTQEKNKNNEPRGPPAELLCHRIQLGFTMGTVINSTDTIKICQVPYVVLRNANLFFTEEA